MPEKIADLLVWYLVFLFSTTCHEFAHAFVAHKGGDDTAYEAGQVTLDPTPHIKRSPIGMVLVPILSLWLSNMMIGWGAAPYNPRWADRYPKRYALMSLAGPMTNLLLSVLGFVLMLILVQSDVLTLVPPSVADADWIAAPIGGETNTALAATARVLSLLFSLNLLLAILNMIPVPPLDGSAVLEGFFHKQVGELMSKLREQPILGLVGLIVAWRVIGYLFWPAWGAALTPLYAAYL